MAFDINSLMQQAKKMQERIREIHDELADERIEASSGGGMVKIVVNGQQEVIQISISEEALQAGAEMLSDMILVAITEAMKKSREIAQQKLGQVTGGLNLPGLNL